jgi:hypothetical protein
MSNLLKYLDSVRDTPFQWGEHDCAMFAAKGTDARCGTSLAARIAAMSIRSAVEYRRLQRTGVTLESMTIAELGEPATGEIQDGDVVLVRTAIGTALGLAVPPVALIAAKRGFAPVPLRTVERFWRVPCLK